MIPTRVWTIGAAGILLALLMVLATYPPAGAQEKANAPAGANPFKGKILMICLKSKAIEDADVLQNVSLTEMAGRQVLIGEWITPDEGGHWTSGLRTTVMMDDVSSVIEFADMAEYS